MYVEPNFKYKKELIAAIKADQKVTVYSPGPFPAKSNGIEFVEGPHYPKAHTWCAQVTLKDGKIISIQ